MPDHSVNPSLPVLAQGLLEDVEGLTSELLELIRSQIEFYRREDVVSRDQLSASVRHNVTYILSGIIAGSTDDLTAPQETGRVRAEQGAPLPEVLQAMRIGFAFLWRRLLATARAAGGHSLDLLLDGATEIWGFADDYSLAVTDSYRAQMSRAMLAADRRSSALVAAVLGQAGSDQTPWEISRSLGMPYEGSFLVVAIEQPGTDESALQLLESRLRALDVASAWRVEPEREIGVLCLPRRRDVKDVLETLEEVTARRVGVSPVYQRLDDSPRALRSALVAMESITAEAIGVRQLPDEALSELVVGNRDATERFVERVLGGVLAMPEEDRNILLDTTQAWLTARGSASEASRVLYCHENTVRHRLRRLEAQLGRQLDDPATVADLVIALAALRAFPELRASRLDQG